MGNICKICKDTDIVETEQFQIITLENQIQSINTTIQANRQQLKLYKESPQDGTQLSNVQLIIISPKNEEQGAQILRDLLKFGNQITIISRLKDENQNANINYSSKKGILKNKGTQMKKLGLPQANQKMKKYIEFEKK